MTNKPVGEGYTDELGFHKYCFKCDTHKLFNSENWNSRDDCWCRACVDEADNVKYTKDAAERAQRIQDVKDGKVTPIVPPMPHRGD